MAFDSNIDVEYMGSIFGKTCYTQLEYHREAVVPLVTSESVAIFVRDAHWAALKPLLSEEYTLEEIRVQISQTGLGNNSPEYILPVGETGDVTSDCLPPFVTVVMAKVPDNTTKTPSGAPNFRLGKAGFSGIPEISQENGLLESGARAAFDAVFEAMEEITVTTGGSPATWQLGMERGEISPEKVVLLETYAKQKLGSQNTRKR